MIWALPVWRLSFAYMITSDVQGKAEYTGMVQDSGCISRIGKRSCPDVAYHIGPRTGTRFLEGVPIFAVEIRSENDYGRQPNEP
jgi:Uma2 family endonuclease